MKFAEYTNGEVVCFKKTTGHHSMNTLTVSFAFSGLIDAYITVAVPAIECPMTIKSFR